MGLDFSPVWQGMDGLIHGTLVTIEVTLAALVLSCLVGLIVGIARLNPRNRVVYSLASTYVLFFRGTPLLVQLFLLFFGLPQLNVTLPAFVCGVIGLGLYSGSYVSEIVRGAIQSIDTGQMEAARSLGMGYAQSKRYVILPQATRVVLPPLGNDFIAMLKDSALISVLALPDILQLGRLYISRTFRAFEGYNTVAILYLLMTLFLSMMVRIIERRTRLPQ